MMLANTEYLIGTIALIIVAPYFIWHLCIAAPKQAKVQERRKLARKRDLAARQKATQARWKELQAGVKESPNDPQGLRELCTFVGNNLSYSEEAYSSTLDAVHETKGSPNAKSAALEVGRIHYGSQRPDFNVTIYDEQAIQNDIQARC